MPLQSRMLFGEIEFVPFGNRGDCISAFQLGVTRF